MLLYLYGAMVEMPPSTELPGIIQTADMFGVQGFKDWLSFLITRDFCHFFHKVCCSLLFLPLLS
jgi:hypothetical protein